MIPPHLSTDSGVTDNDLCERRRKCQRENMCVSSHQPSSAPPAPSHLEEEGASDNNKAQPHTE